MTTSFQHVRCNERVSGSYSGVAHVRFEVIPSVTKKNTVTACCLHPQRGAIKRALKWRQQVAPKRHDVTLQNAVSFIYRFIQVHSQPAWVYLEMEKYGLLGSNNVQFAIKWRRFDVTCSLSFQGNKTNPENENRRYLPNFSTSLTIWHHIPSDENLSSIFGVAVAFSSPFRWMLEHDSYVRNPFNFHLLSPDTKQPLRVVWDR